MMDLISLMEQIIAILMLAKRENIKTGIACFLITLSMKLKDSCSLMLLGLLRSISLMAIVLMQ